MLENISFQEVELLNLHALLGAGGRRDLKDYLKYLLTKQYKREVMVAVFNNKLMKNLLHSLLYMVERDDFDILLAKKRMLQIKELYYGIFDQIHVRYLEVIEDLDSNELVREFGRTSFENFDIVFRSGDPNKIRYEIINFNQEFINLSKKKDARQIIAV